MASATSSFNNLVATWNYSRSTKEMFFYAMFVAKVHKYLEITISNAYKALCGEGRCKGERGRNTNYLEAIWDKTCNPSIVRLHYSTQCLSLNMLKA